MAEVVVLGGGFGGLAAAHELKRGLSDPHQITVVADSDRFFVGFAKLWDLVGIRSLDEGAGTLAALTDQGIRFVNAAVTALDPQTRHVETSVGALDADFLVVALGATRSLGKLARLEPPAYDLYDPGALAAMRAGLDSLEAGRVIISVLGMPFLCPPAPYEAAFLVEEYLRGRGVRDQVEVVVTTPQSMIMPASAQVSEAVGAALTARGIAVHTEHAVDAIDLDRRRLAFADGDSLEYALLLAVPQAAPPPVLADSALAGKGGWIAPDRETARTRFDRVYAVGDCTSVKTLPKAGVFAEAMGRVAAQNIMAEITPADPARYDGCGYCFLEFPERLASAVEGNFFAEPGPDVHMAEPDADTYARKQAFESERLAQWLGA